MKIEHLTGTSVDTDSLPDVDALLMEESKKLHALFSQYNRQLLLIGEMKASKTRSHQEGCSFFHIMEKQEPPNAEELNAAINMFYARTDASIRTMSGGRLGIGRIPPPIVDTYPEASES